MSVAIYFWTDYDNFAPDVSNLTKVLVETTVTKYNDTIFTSGLIESSCSDKRKEIAEQYINSKKCH